MVEAHRPGLFTVPLGTSLVDALAGYLLKVDETDAAALADCLILLPNNRTIRALTESFVRQSRKGVLLPRMIAVGDLALDEQLGAIFDPIAAPVSQTIAPAIDEIDRRVLLARLIAEKRSGISQVESFKLAKHLAAVLDLLEVEQVSLDQVRKEDLKEDLQAHWQSAYDDFLSIAADFAKELEVRGQITAPARRNLLLARFAALFPRDNWVIAAGITTAAPAIARLLKAVAFLPKGMVVWPYIDLTMAQENWDALGPIKQEGASDHAEESHPFFHLELLFDRMAIRREEIVLFPGCQRDATLNAVEQIFARPHEMLGWADLPPSEKRLKQSRVMLAADSAEEALAIAILIREALETQEKRIALVTPDRELAVRVSAQLHRWGVWVDDSAGQPLVQLPPATLLLGLAKMAADRIGPISLLSALKHPLVRAGDNRLEWLESVRLLDLVLRGPRLGLGLTVIADAIATSALADDVKSRLSNWWQQLSPVFAAYDEGAKTDLPTVLHFIIEAATALTEGKIWHGHAGRQLAQLLESYRSADLGRLGKIERGSIPSLLAVLLDSEVSRPVYGSHPRVSIYGLLEARLQQAECVICAGLNEGTWPQLAVPDPWLSPRLRRELDLPGLDRNIGLSAHDLMNLLGAKEVILSRATRDRSGPTVASRFLLRMQALAGPQLERESRAIALARQIDAGEPITPADRPKPMPSKEQRLVNISVTQVEMLRADPYAFYARNILQLKPLETVGGEPDAAWRGVMIHGILEKWAKEDDCDPDKLKARAINLLANSAFHPAIRILWQPRVTDGLAWIARETREMRDAGRRIISTEDWGRLPLAGIELVGQADRIDRNPDGGLVIVDYKSGQPPTAKSVKAGFKIQLGLIGAMAEAGTIRGVKGKVQGFEYWSLAKNKQKGFGFISKPVKEKQGEIAEFIPKSLQYAREAVENWITGEAPFTAKLHPEYAPYEDYNQLMRLNEWYGRQDRIDAE